MRSSHLSVKRTLCSLSRTTGLTLKLREKKLEEEHPQMFWTPCAAHCLNLMMSDLGEKLPKIKKVLVEARKVVVYIYNHGRVLGMLRSLTKQKELHRSCVTRFATSFYTLESMWENRHNVQVLFVSPTWAASSFSKTIDGKKIQKIIGRNEFWDNVYFACQVLSPFVDVIRLVDTEEKPCMAYIYEAMDRAKEQVQKNLGEGAICDMIWGIIDNRWENQLHHPLHSAGFYLNPKIYYSKSLTEMEGNTYIKGGLAKALQRLVPDVDTQVEIRKQMKIYREAMGSFSEASAKKERNTTHPIEWWISYGSDAPDLQKFAIRILSLTCSASPCERNWSIFDHLHSKSRNCLLQAKLNDLVYIQYNKKLERRYKERIAAVKFIDPIVLKEVDENDEWLIPTDEELTEFVNAGEDLTWSMVRDALHDPDDGPRTRSRARAMDDGGTSGIADDIIDMTVMTSDELEEMGIPPSTHVDVDATVGIIAEEDADLCEMD